MFKGMKSVAIVTGASGGLGREFVRLLNQDSAVDEIWAVALEKDRLEKLSQEFGKKIKTFQLDLSKKESLLEIKSLLEKQENCQVTYLINNAGYAKFGSYQDLTLDQSLNLIDLNCKAVVGLSLEMIPLMGENSHLLNIASQAAFQPLPFLNLYAASKVFVCNYSRALNQELKTMHKKIVVTAVCPGWIRTNLINNAQTHSPYSPTIFKHLLTPKQVAEKALKDAQKNKDLSVCGWRTKLQHFVVRISSPKTAMWLWLRQQKIH